MKSSLRHLLFPVLALCLLAGARKPTTVTVGFYPESIVGDPNTFPDPVPIVDSDRKVFRSKIAAISERDIASIYLYQIGDGSVGCVFMLTPHGREALYQLTKEKKGSTLTAIVNNRMIINLYIDRPIPDGIITIPHGMTPQEGLALKAAFKVIAPPNAAKKGSPSPSQTPLPASFSTPPPYFDKPQ